MAVNGRTHEQIAPLFDLKLGQPFLDRPLHDIEVRLVNDWVEFFNNPPHNLYGARASAFDLPFRSHLTTKGYSHRTIRPSNGKNQQAFQRLFIAKPRVDIMTAVKRICGNEIVLTPVEKQLAFRETVDHYRKVKNDTELPIPSLDDFDVFNKSRLFLPNTGVICPTRSPFCRPAKPFSTKVLFVYYTQFMRIPDEVTVDELRLVLPKKFDVIKKAYQTIQTYRDEILSRGNVSLPDLELEGTDTIDNLEEIAVKASRFFEVVAYLDKGHSKTLQEFESRHGQINTEVGPEHLPTPLKIDTRIHRRSKIPLSYETQNIFIQTWQFLNPGGYKPNMRILADPPTAKRLKEIRDEQFKLVREHGQLPNHICRELKIPNFLIPTTAEIDKYQGRCGGRGYPALLRDVENRVWPPSEESLEEFLNNDKGIVFNNKIQLSQLKRNFKKQAKPDVMHTPRAVVRELKEYLEHKENTETLVSKVPKPEGASEVQPEHGEKIYVDIEQEANLKRVRNLENMVLSQWNDFVKITIRRQGNGLNQDELMNKFYKRMKKILDPGCFEEGRNSNLRLFKGVDGSGNQLSFEQGLKERIRSLNVGDLREPSANVNQTQISK